MHKQFLLKALEQAKLGQGICAPNPSVGALAVQNGKIIARAYHKGAGTSHAEQLLLAQFPPKTPDISLYVTLEPCNHWGKTPPCVDAIINHGIKEVIYGFTDPNVLVAEKNTPELLRKAGISVVYHPLEEINTFYQSYLYWTKTKKPWVTVKMAQTLDGKIAGPLGERLYLSNESCAEFTHLQRKNTDLILTSAKTILEDNPLLTARSSNQTIAKPLAIIDRELKLSKNEQALELAKKVHIFFEEGQHQPKDDEKFSYHPIRSKSQLLDLEAIISKLGQLGYHDVWVEAGAEIFSALHKQQLVNRTYLYIVPSFQGINAKSSYVNDQILPFAAAIRWQMMGTNMLLCLDW